MVRWSGIDKFGEVLKFTKEKSSIVDGRWSGIDKFGEVLKFTKRHLLIVDGRWSGIDKSLVKC
jgi:hypothetical protein